MNLQNVLDEVTAIKEEIEDRMGPEQPAILVCVSNKCVSRVLREDMGDKINEMTRIESNSANLQSHINFFQGMQNKGAKRLFIVFSKSFGPSLPPLSVPDSFRVCEITYCFGAKVGFNDKITYYGIPLSSPHLGPPHLSQHEPLARHNVVFELEPPPPPYGGHNPTPPFPVDPGSGSRIVQMINAIMRGINRDRFPKALPWFAGAGCAFLLITSVDIMPDGICIRVGPGSFPKELINNTGPLPATIAIATAVYFIPWRRLGEWLLTQRNTFLLFLENIREFVGDRFSGLLSMIIQYL